MALSNLPPGVDESMLPGFNDSPRVEYVCPTRSETK